MKLPSLAITPTWARFLAAAAIFIAWFVVVLMQPPVVPPAKPLLDPNQFVTYVRYVLVGLVGYHAADKMPSPGALQMRLVAGIALLAMWAWLVVAKIVPPSDLIDAMALGLFMLGVLPSQQGAGAPPSIPPASLPAIPGADRAPQPSQPTGDHS